MNKGEDKLLCLAFTAPGPLCLLRLEVLHYEWGGRSPAMQSLVAVQTRDALS